MKTSPKTSPNAITEIVERNVNTLLERKKDDREKRSLAVKAAHSISNFAGSITFVVIHIVLFSVWIAWNAGFGEFTPFDPSFIYLATFAAVEAIFLTTFVLIGQKQMNAQAEKFSDLDLHVSLLTEHEVTAMLKMVRAIAKKMEIEVVDDDELEELSKKVHPNKVIDTMEKANPDK